MFVNNEENIQSYFFTVSSLFTDFVFFLNFVFSKHIFNGAVFFYWGLYLFLAYVDVQ